MPRSAARSFSSGSRSASHARPASRRRDSARDLRIPALLPQSSLEREQERTERRGIECRDEKAVAVLGEMVRVRRLETVRLVPYEHARLFAEAELAEDALDCTDLLIAIRIGRVDDVDEQIG